MSKECLASKLCLIKTKMLASIYFFVSLKHED